MVATIIMLIFRIQRISSNSFNDYFVEVGPNLAQQIPQTANNFETFITPVESTFELHDFTESEITNKAGGLDDIPANFIKASVSVIAKSLTHIFNLS